MDFFLNFFDFFTQSLQSTIDLSSGYAAYWGPVVFGFIFIRAWLYYVRTDYLSKMRWALIEIHLPKDIYKPPQAMEFVIAGLDQPRSGSLYERWWKGFLPTWFSLEIASIGGDVRFFIRTQTIYKDFVESRIYSQFPEVELSEAPDYTQFYNVPESGWVTAYGAEIELTKPDPLPIKTYVDYEMHKGYLDEKQRIDPMTPMLEFFGSMNSDEQAWLQIMVQSHRKRYKKEDGTAGDWRDEAKDVIKKIMEGEKKAEDTGEEKKKERPQLTKTQTENIAAIERNMAKPGLDCGIRMIYMAEPGKFRIPNIPGISGSFKAFNSAELNGFKSVRSIGFNVPWEEIDAFLGLHRLGYIRRKFFDAYRRRSYFYPPYQRKPFVLTTEELATIFHLPSAIAETPTLRRIESKKSEPPGNLPV